MRSSIFVATAAAALAMAKPIVKREMETTWVVVWDTVTVTAQPETTTASPTEEDVIAVVTVTTFVGQPEPTTTSPPVVVVPPTTETVAPPPATTEAPVVVPEPEPVTTTLAPVVTTKENAPAPTTTAPTTTAPATDDSTMQGAALAHHNMHRANHSSPSMTWNDEIAGYAKTAADSCVFEHKMDIGAGGYGQNLAMWATSSGIEDLGEVGAIKMATSDFWYNGEYPAYAPYFGKEPDMGNFMSWGHLSQLLWADSTELGCYVKLCGKGTMYSDMDAYFMVCNYGPPGNVGGGYATNVKAPLGNPMVTA